ncbi:uncharacterized protein LOC110007583 isoform X1 [Amborella trichopoda]|uniref:TF-B3 domain-containing protein n=1 Tax=Amborella trichopoda TaxID=13333 RepID=W1PMU7_AMBTC|nr:uncharacterized protein LOC110007583 isoform X1 [Amborella trichopoda]ERN09378.1 hypothetical protein AMTR_s00029p00026560 [Amborella trichopoda]|eukprot:XP_020524950.1 uncharacterized protein LOC110007583 isoform X1 [Amborella trichopoda]
MRRTAKPEIIHESTKEAGRNREGDGSVSGSPVQVSRSDSKISVPVSSSTSPGGIGTSEVENGHEFSGWISGEIAGSRSMSDTQIKHQLFGPTGSVLPVDSFVNLEQSVRVGGRETIDFKQVFQVNQRFTFPASSVQPQPGYFHGSETCFSQKVDLNSMFAPSNSFDINGERLWRSDATGSSYSVPCNSYDNALISSNAPSNLKRMIDISTDQYLLPTSICPNPVYQASSRPNSPITYQHLFPVSTRDSCNSNACCKHGEEFGNHAFSSSGYSRASEVPEYDGSTDNDVFASRKRKVVPQRRLNMKLGVNLDGNKNAYFGHDHNGLQLPKHGELGAFETNPCLHQLGRPSSSRHKVAAENLAKDDKELEVKGLMLALRKELRNSDVGNLGRIVLPKKDAEANLPLLTEREGQILHMEDMDSSAVWKFKFRYWPNNKSRMYVMENTGDFVKTHCLGTGDFFIIYKDEAREKYMVRGKKGAAQIESLGSVLSNCESQDFSDKEREISTGFSGEQTKAMAPYHLMSKPKSECLPASFSMDFEREANGLSFDPLLLDLNPDMSFNRHP